MIKTIKQTLFALCAMLCFYSLAAQADSLQNLFHQSSDPVAGNPKGKITIVEFFDYQCSHCIDMGPVMAAIVKENPDVRIVFKEFPIRGAASEFASRAALAANLQGKYKTFHHALLGATQPLSEDIILKTASNSGLNIEKLKKDMASNSITSQLDNNRRLAIALKLRGTPAFYIGKTDAKNSDEVKFVLGEMTQSQLQNEINHLKK